MRTLLLTLVIALVAVAETGCAPVERQAYNTFVGANAFLKNIKSTHPECADAGNTSTLCVDVRKAVSAKDALIDAAEVYCAGPNFNATGECDAPKKGTPGADQAVAKLKAAIASYAQAQLDVKGVLN